MTADPEIEPGRSELNPIFQQLVRDVRVVASPQVAPYFLPERQVIARQGVQCYTAIMFAQREDWVLFVAPDTRQLGIGFLEGIELTGARQYPEATTAIRSFLGRREDLDPK